jgi:hypothetical protein
MSIPTRFHAREDWSIIPGPAQLSQPMNSQDLQEVATYSAAEIAESLLGFPGMRLVHASTPSWWEWRARWKSGRDFIEVGMTLFDDELQSWGGSPLRADCAIDAITALWSYLLSRHRGVWLHDSDCWVHTKDSFRAAVGS